MNTAFPFGFSGPTGLYLALYVITLSVHVVFMNYTVAGTGTLLALKLSGRDKSPSGAILGDWLTAALSMAITAGVAPLLFLQVLYKTPFYTANLLLFTRWMLIVPALIVGFYMLYLMKSERVKAASPWVGRAAAALALATFLFTGFTWSENHLLSQNPAAWSDFYTQGRSFYTETALLPRLALWMVGGLSTLAVMLGWQRLVIDADDPAAFSAAQRSRDTGRLALLGLAGIALGTACCLWYAAVLPEASLAALSGPMASPYLAAAAVGVVLQVGVWVQTLRAKTLTRGRLAAASLGAGLAILGTTVAREALRIAHTDMQALSAAHEKAAGQGGGALFVAFFIINGLLIAWCVVTARRSIKHPRASQDGH